MQYLGIKNIKDNFKRLKMFKKKAVSLALLKDQKICMICLLHWVVQLKLLLYDIYFSTNNIKSKLFSQTAEY